VIGGRLARPRGVSGHSQAMQGVGCVAWSTAEASGGRHDRVGRKENEIAHVEGWRGIGGFYNKAASHRGLRPYPNGAGRLNRRLISKKKTQYEIVFFTVQTVLFILRTVDKQPDATAIKSSSPYF
jgi:hypothetical protein